MSRRRKRGQTAVLVTPYNSRKTIPRQEARLQVQFCQAEMVSDEPFTVRSLWFPAFKDELKYQEGRYVTGFTHGAWNGKEGNAGVVRCRPPAGRFSPEYIELKGLMAQGPIKRGV